MEDIESGTTIHDDPAAQAPVQRCNTVAGRCCEATLAQSAEIQDPPALLQLGDRPLHLESRAGAHVVPAG
jgi:hypothetical protein